MGFTRNYDMLRMLSMGLDTDLYKFESTFDFKPWFLKKTNGELVYSYTSHAYSYNGGSPVSTISPFRDWRTATTVSCGRCSLVVGTDNTPETYDDYKISTFTCNTFLANSNIDANGSFAYHPENKHISNTITVSFFNSSGTTQTVNEIGVLMCNELLIYRKVLETPLTVPPDGYFKVSFNYSVPVPEVFINKG